MSTNVLIKLCKTALSILTSCLRIRNKSKFDSGEVPKSSYKKCSSIVSKLLTLVTRPSKRIVPSSLIRLGKDDLNGLQFIQGMITRSYKIIVLSSLIRLRKGIHSEYQFVQRVVTRLPKIIVLNSFDKVQKRWFFHQFVQTNDHTVMKKNSVESDLIRLFKSNFG